MGNHIVMWDPDKRSSETIRPQSFEEIGASERYDLQEWIKQNPEILGERLFIITSEFDKFEKSQKRLDLLALDEEGKLVIVELKRDAAGTLADLQAIRYAASCSTVTAAQIIEMRAKYASVSTEIAKQEIAEFLHEDTDSSDLSVLDNKPRILIAAGGFEDQQITTSVLWLRTFGVDISCVEVTPYRVENDKRVILVPRVIIPLPEAKNYIESVEAKEIEQARISSVRSGNELRNQEIRARFSEIAPDLEPREEGTDRRSMYLPTGHGGISFAWWQHGQGPDKWLDVALRIRTASKDENQKLCDFLKERKERIEQELGQSLTFEPWGEKFWRVYVQRPREPWNDETVRWAAETMLKLAKVVQPLVEEFYAEA